MQIKSTWKPVTALSLYFCYFKTNLRPFTGIFLELFFWYGDFNRPKQLLGAVLKDWWYSPTLFIIIRLREQRWNKKSLHVKRWFLHLFSPIRYSILISKCFADPAHIESVLGTYYDVHGWCSEGHQSKPLAPTINRSILLHQIESLHTMAQPYQGFLWAMGQPMVRGVSGGY